MKRIHLLLADPSTSRAEDTFRPLVDAVRSDGGRVGVLRWNPEAPSDDETMAAANRAGLLRSIRVDAAGAVAHKPRQGPAVLRDVVREHFRGCRLVIIEGEAAGELADLPQLFSAQGGRLRVEKGGATREFEAGALAGRLRGPHPFHI